MTTSGDAPVGGHTIDLARTTTRLGSVVPGYGLTPSSAHARAAMVRAVTDDERIRQRPYPVVLVTGVVALVALAIWVWQLWVAIDTQGPLELLFWAALATFLVAAAVCSWAWQLYDVRKAIVMWLAIVLLTAAAALVLAFVLVALKGDGDLDLDLDLDGLLDKITGSSGDLVGDVVLPVVEDAVYVAGAAAADGGGFAGGGWAGDTAASEGACPSCGVPLVLGSRTCSACGWEA
jgi:hypothetical protein